MGCDVCYTNHAEADGDDMDSLLLMLGAAGCNFIMGVPGSDDIMLNYQSTSFHDALVLRQLLGLRAAPEFEAWQQAMGITSAGDARIALGRAGVSLPTAAHLAFQLAHAQARDAVHLPFDAHGIQASLQALGLPTPRLHSQALERAMYLQRPDLGRRLDAASLQTLADWQTQHGDTPGFDVAFVLVDGLSALAIHQNAVALVSLMLQRLQSDTAQPWTVAPLTVVAQGRVAIGDEVGAALRAKTMVVLIGERPGLSSPDSLGIYLTWAPKVGTTDAARNCISNVRPAGLSVEAAAATLHALLTQARQRQLTGVGLKDDVDHALMDRQGAKSDQAQLPFWQSQSRDSR